MIVVRERKNPQTSRLRNKEKMMFRNPMIRTNGQCYKALLEGFKSIIFASACLGITTNFFYCLIDFDEIVYYIDHWCALAYLTFTIVTYVRNDDTSHRLL